MPDPPKFTKADLNKILNCQDQLHSSLVAMISATKNLNEQSIKLEKQASGVPITTKGSAYYNNVKNRKALDAANRTIDKLIKQYSVDIVNVEKNLGILNSQEIYQKRIHDLINYYKNNIESDKEQIQEVKGKRSVANRMTTFYNARDQTSQDVKKYTSYVYWGIFILASIMLLYNLFMGGYASTALPMAIAVIGNIKNASLRAVDGVKKRIQNPLSTAQLAQIQKGPNTMARQSKIFGRMRGGATGDYSLQPWLGIVMIFGLTPIIIIPYILKPLIPYITDLLLPGASH